MAMPEKVTIEFEAYESGFDDSVEHLTVTEFTDYWEQPKLPTNLENQGMKTPQSEWHKTIVEQGTPIENSISWCAEGQANDTHIH